MHDFVYLASQSPRRLQLLEQLGVTTRSLVAKRRENVERLEEERSGESPDDYVRRVTLAKLLAARNRLAREGGAVAPILTADTTVAVGRRVYGKPRDADEAAATLAALSGRWHRVLTAVAVSHGAQSLLKLSTSRVRFAALSQRTIEAYVASGEPFGKAGAYAIQGPISAWIERIDGSYSGIMGLPLFETRELLAQARVRRAAAAA
jgi:septum formation protein